MAIKPIDQTIRESDVTDKTELQRLTEGLKSLDKNSDGRLETSEVADESGYLICNPTTGKWWYTTLGPVENALFKAELVSKLRNSICLNTRPVMSDRSDAVEVVQREYAITRPKNGRVEYLQTFGAGPCIVLTLYDPRTKTGLMAHIDANTNIETSFGLMTAHLKKYGVDITKMEARLVGGDSTSEETVTQLQSALKQRGIKVVEEDVIRQSPASVMLDTNTGRLFDYTETIHTTDQGKLGLLPFIVQQRGNLMPSNSQGLLK